MCSHYSSIVAAQVMLAGTEVMAIVTAVGLSGSTVDTHKWRDKCTQMDSNGVSGRSAITDSITGGRSSSRERISPDSRSVIDSSLLYRSGLGAEVMVDLIGRSTLASLYNRHTATWPTSYTLINEVNS